MDILIDAPDQIISQSSTIKINIALTGCAPEIPA